MRFRIGTLNVHWVVRPKGMDQFVKLVFDNKLDILVIQEGQSDAVQKFVNKLNESEKEQSVNSIFKWSHASAMPSFLCNSIISRYPIIEQHTVCWDWLQYQKHKHVGSKENRSAVLATIMIKQDINDKDEEIKTQHINDCTCMISIMCTHLDHIDEDCRLLQINHFLDNNYKTQRNDKNKQYPDILCGDFNSLLQSDYTINDWNKIADIRRNTNWETPKNELMSKLLLNDNDKMGYYDTLESSLKQTFYVEKYLENVNDKNKMEFAEFNERVNLPKWTSSMANNGGNVFNKFFKNMNIKYKNKNEEKEQSNELDGKLNAMFFEYFSKRWEATCRFHTRIDYILVLKHLLSNNKWRLIDFGFQDTIKTELTDHKLYWCEFELECN